VFSFCQPPEYERNFVGKCGRVSRYLQKKAEESNLRAKQAINRTISKQTIQSTSIPGTNPIENRGKKQHFQKKGEKYWVGGGSYKPLPLRLIEKKKKYKRVKKYSIAIFVKYQIMPCLVRHNRK